MPGLPMEQQIHNLPLIDFKQYHRSEAVGLPFGDSSGLIRGIRMPKPWARLYTMPAAMLDLRISSIHPSLEML